VQFPYLEKSRCSVDLVASKVLESQSSFLVYVLQEVRKHLSQSPESTQQKTTLFSRPRKVNKGLVIFQKRLGRVVLPARTSYDLNSNRICPAGSSETALTP